MAGAEAFRETLLKFQEMPFPPRIECISRRFLGLPFSLDPLGEGQSSEIDRDPMYRFDTLDCMTYVEAVIALAHSRSLVTFAENLATIRYREDGSEPDIEKEYWERLHFVEADWIPENSARGFIEVITAKVGGRFTKKTGMVLDRKKWIEGKSDLTAEEKKEAVEGLTALGINRPETVTMDYIPISAFFMDDGKGKPKFEIAERLPEISIFLLLRNEKAASEVGVLVAHMGFLLKAGLGNGKAKGPAIRHGTNRVGVKYPQIMEEPLFPYLKSLSPRIAGVAILKINAIALR